MAKRKPKEEHLKTGRPSIYTAELADRICQIVATNTHGLPRLCAMFPELPNEDTIRVWRWEKSEFSAKYAQAKMFQAELMAEQLRELSEQKLMYTDAEGNDRVDSGYTAAQRLQVDTIKWMASKLAPKIYGDKIQNEVTLKHEDDLKALG